MRRLLNTLFVTSEDVYLSLDGENVVVKREQAEAGRFPVSSPEDALRRLKDKLRSRPLLSCSCRARLSSPDPSSRRPRVPLSSPAP